MNARTSYTQKYAYIPTSPSVRNLLVIFVIVAFIYYLGPLASQSAQYLLSSSLSSWLRSYKCSIDNESYERKLSQFTRMMWPDLILEKFISDVQIHLLSTTIA